ncbi:hypothetical protein B0T21DRAFT_180683 [Apiosordaria backusii]|uniref:Uncharacterized protein n=1 Tax=Apiosordaria backusii TaxID=314023 RepID=A0AA40EHR5_9PEZI|nr:hypothetical protein B0T21DRAFT_180683 [Apiosordaria backusii]
MMWKSHCLISHTIRRYTLIRWYATGKCDWNGWVFKQLPSKKKTTTKEKRWLVASSYWCLLLALSGLVAALPESTLDAALPKIVFFFFWWAPLKMLERWKLGSLRCR